MKILQIIIFFLFLNIGYSQNISPYILGVESTESPESLIKTVRMNLEKNAINVVGEYSPANDKNRTVLVISSTELDNSVKKIGGLAAFASVLKVALTTDGTITKVSYTNPTYWGYAYYRFDFDKVSANFMQLKKHLENAMKESGTFIGKSFGSKKGLSTKDLQKYHYMIGMPYFDDTVELGSFSNHATAVSKIDANIKKGIPGVKLVFKKTIPGKNATLYGFALSSTNGESKFLPIIDTSLPKHTAFLPYEVLVDGDKVVMLHGRFRFAISFPDLTMGKFSKIMSTPGDVEKLLQQVVK